MNTIGAEGSTFPLPTSILLLLYLPALKMRLMYSRKKKILKKSFSVGFACLKCNTKQSPKSDYKMLESSSSKNLIDIESHQTTVEIDYFVLNIKSLSISLEHFDHL